MHLEDNRAFDIFRTSDRLGVFGDRQSREVLLCRNCQGVSRKIPSTSLKLAGPSSGATSSYPAADEYICGLEKRSRVFVRNELQASFRIRTSQTAPRLIAEFSLSTFRIRVAVHQAMSALGHKRPRKRIPAKGHVSFTPESRHVQCNTLRLLWANSGHDRFVAKEKFRGCLRLNFDEVRIADSGVYFTSLRSLRAVSPACVLCQWHKCLGP